MAFEVSKQRLDFRCNLAAAVAEGVINFTGSPNNWQQRLLYYAVDVPAGRAEFARAQQVYREKAIIGDKDGAERAHRWAEQIRLATGISP